MNLKIFTLKLAFNLLVHVKGTQTAFQGMSWLVYLTLLEGYVVTSFRN